MAEIYDKTTSTWTNETGGPDIDNDYGAFGDTSAGTMKRSLIKNWVGSILADLRSRWTPASTSGPASLDFLEDADNGTNKIRVIGQSSLGADRDLTLPDETGTLATRAYADALVAGLSWKQAVRVATTANGTLATAFENGDTVDGVTLVTGDRILIKNQSDPKENGIYVVAASGSPSRATDADSGAELVNASVYVQEGTANADKQFVCTTNATITIGATNITFTEFSSGSGIGGSTGSTDNRILRADGTGGSTAQSSGAEIDDNGYLATATAATASTLNFYTLGDTNTGISMPGSDNMIFIVGGDPKVAFSGLETAFNADSAFQYGWTSGDPISNFIDTGLRRVAATIVGVSNGSTGGGALQFTEMTSPAAPATNNVVLFAEDNGAGKTRLMARFATGATQQLAIEP